MTLMALSFKTLDILWGYGDTLRMTLRWHSMALWHFGIPMALLKKVYFLYVVNIYIL